MIICLQKKKKGERFLSESYFHLIAFTESDAQESIQFNEQIQDWRKDQIRMRESSHNFFPSCPIKSRDVFFDLFPAAKNCITTTTVVTWQGLRAKILQEYFKNIANYCVTLTSTVTWQSMWAKIFQDCFKNIAKYCVTLTAAVTWQSMWAKMLQKYLINHAKYFKMLQKYCNNISKTLQKYCVTFTPVVTWRSMRATQRMKTMRLQCQQHMTTHNQYFIAGVCLFLCFCLCKKN